MDAFEYLSVLNKEQKEAVVHSGSPLLILAGAGSGKTRVITTKIAYMISELGINPYSILAVTFTKKAANEMQERAIFLEPQAAKSQIRTFHSFGSWFLRRYAEEAGIDKNFTVYDDDDMVSLLLKAVPNINRQQANGIASKISRAKDYCLLPEDSDKFSQYDIDSSAEFIEMYQAYQKRLRQTGNVDFGDLILLPVLLLRNDEKIRSDIHSRFKVVMVDEYQDSNVAQFALLEQLAGKDTYICVVGDDDQSIYKFRGAEVENILTFQDHFEGTQVIKLETNYRSISPVLSSANSVIANNKNRLGKTLISHRDGEKKPVVAFLSNQDDEVEYVCELIKKSHKDGVPYSDWAVLYRMNAQSLGFETEFLHRKIPYSVVGSLKFYQREEIKDALSFLAFLSNPKDEVAFSRIVNKPARGIGKTSQEKVFETFKLNSGSTLIENYSLIDASLDALSNLPKKAKEGLSDFVKIVQDLLKMLKENSTEKEETSLTSQLAESSLVQKENESEIEVQNVLESFNRKKKLSEFIEKMIKDSGFQEYYENQDEIAHTQKANNLQELINSASLYNLSVQGLTDFLDHIELDRTLELADEEQENPDRVTLITLHNTKGLEFPRVVITGMEHGLFPRVDKVDEELEEERRLFYVGITRARDELYLTSCGFRRMYGKTEIAQPSPFLLELDKSNIEFKGKVPLAFKSDKSPVGKSFNQNTLEGRWKRGVKVYHDDYGYGYIMNGDDSGDEYLITVQFETGAVKRFMPKYQSNRLTIIN